LKTGQVSLGKGKGLNYRAVERVKKSDGAKGPYPSRIGERAHTPSIVTVDNEENSTLLKREKKRTADWRGG